MEFQEEQAACEQLVVADLTPYEVRELCEWLTHTKPIGPSVKIHFKQGAWTGFALTTTGTRLGSECPTNEFLHSEVFIG